MTHTQKSCVSTFLSTLSLRRATKWGKNDCGRSWQFLSTLSLRRATTWTRGSRVTYVISIHALLAESDPHCYQQTAYFFYFYPRSPCGERRHKKIQNAGACLFLSTLSLRRATTWTRGSRVTYVISIHALLAESDFTSVVSSTGTIGFLSTLSLRRATVTVLGIQHRAGISIHALLAESDRLFLIVRHLFNNFYPRSPCGERRHQ